jgi:hypothetical protein
MEPAASGKPKLKPFSGSDMACGMRTAMTTTLDLRMLAHRLQDLLQILVQHAEQGLDVKGGGTKATVPRIELFFNKLAERLEDDHQIFGLADGWFMHQISKASLFLEEYERFTRQNAKGVECLKY